MNYYNPYFANYPSMTAGTSTPGLFRSLFKGSGINWGSLLSNTQKTIGIVNQAIPMVKQVTPMFRNVKTMFKVMNEFKKPEGTTSNTTPALSKNSVAGSGNVVAGRETVREEPTFIENDGPQFFI